MKTAYLYYLAAFLAVTAAVIAMVRAPGGGSVEFHTIFLVAMAALLAWLGTREVRKRDQG